VPVVDASVVVDWVAPDADPAGPAAEFLRRLHGAGAEVLGPRLLVQEVANALLTGVRRGRWSGAKADRAARHLWAMPWRVWEPEGIVPDAWELSRRYDSHPVYDMVYLATARSAGTTLVTADERLVAVLGSDHRVVGPHAWTPGSG
jgi:predicted nucleic acid-binding protein